MNEGSASRWAHQTFAMTPLGDIRRSRRLVAMATSTARRPSGKVSEVFDRTHEREGAYDFLENDAIKASDIAEMLFAATVEQAKAEPLAYVVVDGTSLTLTDAKASKGFGPVGSPNRPARGLQVMNALGVSRHGVPLGLVDQLFWARPPLVRRTRAEAAKRNARRPFEDKEAANFVLAAQNAVKRLARAAVNAWVIIDREADNRDILLGLAESECLYTVRSRWDRPTLGGDGLRQPNLRQTMREQPLLGTYSIDIGRTGRRAARTATVTVRARLVELHFRKRGHKPQESLRVWAVWLQERTTHPDPLDWLLFTNVPVTNAEQAERIVESYRTRWRVEEFHRTWKQGECNVEDAQLRSMNAMVKWATIHAAVATRIERLKYLSRNKPDEPATLELDEDEIEALKLDQRRRAPGAKKARGLPEMPTIGEATRWIAELGGWIGPSNGPPGAVTIARGMRRLGDFVYAIRLARKPSQDECPT